MARLARLARPLLLRVSPGRKTLGAPGAVRSTALGLLVLLLATAGLAGADPKPSEEAPTVAWSAKVDPSAVAPGGEGVLVVTGKIRDQVHVFSGKALKVLPTSIKGVTWGKPTFSKTKKWSDPNLPEDPPADVWMGSMEIRLPFTLDKDVALPLPVSTTIKWNCCDEETCYAEATTKPPVGAEIAAPAKPAGGAAAAGLPSGLPAAPKRLASASASSPEATVIVVATSQAFEVTFEPTPGHYLYALGADEGVPVSVKGREAEGVRWARASAPPSDPHVAEPYTVTLPYADESEGRATLAVTVSWQACLDSGTCRSPEPPHRFELRRDGAGYALVETWDGVPAATAAPAPAVAPAPAPATAGAAPPAAGAVAATGLLFEVLGTAEESFVAAQVRRWGWLVLGVLFAIGVGLAFTPCVLPIIPITVSIVGGANPSTRRGRLVFLLSCYVAGLSLAFGAMGLVAAKAGASFSAVFESPVALWVIAGIFAVLAFGMFGLYELQPPQWAQRLMGGAKGGSPVGSFLFGGLSALIASPCTGPVIAGLIVFTAQSGNALFGFLMFVSLGLGMGAVFFAAGSLNLLAKPGPWMAWVRYLFGALLVGVALYYLRNAGRIGPYGLLALAAALAVLAAVGIRHHLVAKEAEDPRVARRRGVQVAFMTVACALLAGVFSGGLLPEASASGGGDGSLWDKRSALSREELVRFVDEAKRDGVPVVIDFWAEWCTYCKSYDREIEKHPDIVAALRQTRRLKLDLTDEDRPWEAGIREGLGVPPGTQPYLVFLDSAGRIRRDLDIKSWLKDEAADGLRARLKAVLPASRVVQVGR